MDCNNFHELELEQKKKEEEDFPLREKRKVCGGGFEGLGTGCLEAWYEHWDMRLGTHI